LFTLFSFTSLQLAIKRLKIFSLDDDDDDDDDDLLERLKNFNVKDAHCYDPNEETKLRYIIVANGEDEFNRRVRDLACKAFNNNDDVSLKVLSQ